MLQTKAQVQVDDNSCQGFLAADNLLSQTLAPTRPNEVCVTDITYVILNEGKLYLAGVKEVFTCELVGYAIGSRMTKI